MLGRMWAGHLEPTAMEDRPRLVPRLPPLEMEPVTPNLFRGDVCGSSAVACGELQPGVLSHP